MRNTPIYKVILIFNHFVKKVTIKIRIRSTQNLMSVIAYGRQMQPKYNFVNYPTINLNSTATFYLYCSRQCPFAGYDRNDFSSSVYLKLGAFQN